MPFELKFIGKTVVHSKAYSTNMHPDFRKGTIPEKAPNATANNFQAGNDGYYGHLMKGMQFEF